MEIYATFDSIANTYDDEFTHTPIAQLLRRTVWARLDANFRAGMRMLELGCGTGEDAIHFAQRGVYVTATDASAPMLAITQDKAARAGVGAWVQTARLDLNHPTNQPPYPVQAHSRPRREATQHGTYHLTNQLPFDGVFSNFGALNCISNLQSLISSLYHSTKPHARIVLVVMGPFCPWEIIWHLAHLQPRQAFRRWARHGATAHVGGERVHVWYPSPRRLARLFAPHFKHLRTSGLGVLLPPPYVRVNSKGNSIHRSLFAANWLEGRIAHHFPFNQCGDHYILELERR